MNKSVKLFAACIFAAAAMVSCNREDIVEPNASEHFISVLAELPAIEQEEETKAYLGSFISSKWSKGDEVSVVNLSTGKILGGSLTADKDGIATTFSGTVAGKITKGDNLALVYPSFGVSSETSFGESRKYSLSEQTKASGVPLITHAIFQAPASNGTITGLSLDFFYALSFLKINMANLPPSATVSKVEIRNIPVEFSISINGSKTGFTVSSESERAVKGQLTIVGAYKTKSTGALSVTVGVMPSDETDNRTVVVTVDGDGDYISPLTSAELSSDQYYNTVASQFERLSLAGKTQYGMYQTKSGAVIDEYDQLNCSLVSGTENGECDFSVLNNADNKYWTLKGLPSEVSEGLSFDARLLNYGVSGCPEGTLESAKIKKIEPDGDFSKLWIKAGDYLFIVRK